MNNEHNKELLLGQLTQYPEQYDAGLLFPVARAPKWLELGLDPAQLPFVGEDVWLAWEVSWLNTKGKPVVAVAEVRLPANSPNIIESKSFKLYLNGFNQLQLANWQAAEALMVKDLSQAAAAPVSVRLLSLAQAEQLLSVCPVQAICIDDLDIDCQHYQPRPQLLRQSELPVKQSLVSHLLKSNCPVTGQPDWASLVIDYRGGQLDLEALLAYVVSFRMHTDFHEQCVERIYQDLWSLGGMQELTVYARYLRRGGLDINPWRSSHQPVADNRRLVRQ